MNVCDIDKQRDARTLHFNPPPYHRRDRIPLSSDRFLPANQFPFPGPSSLKFLPPTFDMSDQSGSSPLRALFEAALEDYKRRTGVDLATHPLAERLQHHDSVDSITDTLRDQAQGFEQFREKDRVLRSILKILTVLDGLASVANFALHVGLVCQ